MISRLETIMHVNHLQEYQVNEFNDASVLFSDELFCRQKCIYSRRSKREFHGLVQWVVLIYLDSWPISNQLVHLSTRLANVSVICLKIHFYNVWFVVKQTAATESNQQKKFLRARIHRNLLFSNFLERLSNGLWKIWQITTVKTNANSSIPSIIQCQGNSSKIWHSTPENKWNLQLWILSLACIQMIFFVSLKIQQSIERSMSLIQVHLQQTKIQRKQNKKKKTWGSQRDQVMNKI